MKNVTIFGFWLLTIAIGSVIFGLCASMLDRPSNNLSDSFGIIAISAMLSFLFSIPAVITFLVANTKLKEKYQNSNTYKKKMYSTHLIVGSIYFVITLFIGISQGIDALGFAALIGLLFSYLPVGLLSWYYGFKLININKPSPEDILDTQ